MNTFRSRAMSLFSKVLYGLPMKKVLLELKKSESQRFKHYLGQVLCELVWIYAKNISQKVVNF